MKNLLLATLLSMTSMAAFASYHDYYFSCEQDDVAQPPAFSQKIECNTGNSQSDIVQAHIHATCGKGYKTHHADSTISVQKNMEKIHMVYGCNGSFQHAQIDIWLRNGEHYFLGSEGSAHPYLAKDGLQGGGMYCWHINRHTRCDIYQTQIKAFSEATN